MWAHHQVKDGTYSFKDLLDAHELLDFKEINQARFEEWMKAQNDG